MNIKPSAKENLDRLIELEPELVELQNKTAFLQEEINRLQMEILKEMFATGGGRNYVYKDKLICTENSRLRIKQIEIIN